MLNQKGQSTIEATFALLIFMSLVGFCILFFEKQIIRLVTDDLLEFHLLCLVQDKKDCQKITRIALKNVGFTNITLNSKKQNHLYWVHLSARSPFSSKKTISINRELEYDKNADWKL